MNNSIDDNLGIIHDIRAILLKVLKKIGLYRLPTDTNKLEHFTSFDEHPPCELCGQKENREVFKALDGCRIVACIDCGLWFTSPRIDEEKWTDFLTGADTERNAVITENRLRFGVALPRQTKLSRSGWFRRIKQKYGKVIDIITAASDTHVSRLHDVGCGVGYFLITARDRGMEVSGNDLNEYAVKIMRERFKLDVFHGMLDQLPRPEGTLDAVAMNAYIEHTYHPLADLKAAFRLLKENGIIYVSTFHTDSAAYKKFGSQWDMFAWNHVYHFSSKTLEEMMKKAGFEILKNNMTFDLPISYILGKKP